ncbi:hypothetical protein MM560_G3n191 [Manis javanica]|nr:hypothetical protein MM560_G3n191 [Manis javanica]
MGVTARSCFQPEFYQSPDFIRGLCVIPARVGGLSSHPKTETGLKRILLGGKPELKFLSVHQSSTVTENRDFVLVRVPTAGLPQVQWLPLSLGGGELPEHGLAPPPLLPDPPEAASCQQGLTTNNGHQGFGRRGSWDSRLPQVLRGIPGLSSPGKPSLPLLGEVPWPLEIALEFLLWRKMPARTAGRRERS